MNTDPDVIRFVHAADALVNALATEKPPLDAKPLFVARIEKRVADARTEYDNARETIMGDPADQGTDK